LKVATPLLFSAAVPSKCISVHRIAEASQKFTCPGVTAVVPAITVAVSVTTLPEAIELPDDTGWPPEVIAS
jgi:hypothetical protein